MTIFFMIVGAMLGCAIDMTFIHNVPVYGHEWLAPIWGAVGGLCVRAIMMLMALMSRYCGT